MVDSEYLAPGLNASYGDSSSTVVLVNAIHTIPAIGIGDRQCCCIVDTGTSN